MPLTDHRLQQAIVQDVETKVWVPRSGGSTPWKCKNVKFMHTMIMDSLRSQHCSLAIVGYVYLGTLAGMAEAEQISVKALLFTYRLVVDETRS